MPEGLSAAEVGGEIGHHSRHSGGHHGGGRHDRVISISEAILLSVVAIIAAWSGYSAAKWGTESSLQPRQGLGDADAGEPRLPAVADVPGRRRIDVQRVVRSASER